jgi:hypothetical protein
MAPEPSMYSEARNQAREWRSGAEAVLHEETPSQERISAMRICLSPATLRGSNVCWVSLVLLGGGIKRSNGDEPVPAPAGATTHTLAECLQMAHDRQHRLAAYRASLAAAEDNKAALEALHLPASLARELSVRRKQAGLGVAIAAAGLEQAEHDTTYAVTRTFYTVVYAREQERLAR